MIAGECGRDLGHLHEGKNSFVHASAAAGTADDNQRKFFYSCPFDETGELFADDGTHAAHDEGGIGDAEGDAAGADHTGADNGGFGEAGAFLLGLEALSIWFFVGELERIAGRDAGEPFLEGAFVEDLPDAFLSGDVEVEVALGAGVQLPLGFFFVDRGLTAGALEPEPFGNAAFGAPGSWRFTGCGFEFADGHDDGSLACDWRIFLEARRAGVSALYHLALDIPAETGKPEGAGRNQVKF